MLASVNAADLEKTYGMEVTDVHIKRVNYIENVRKRVYDRMKSERTRIASLFESEAQETYNRILGSTRKELDEIEGASWYWLIKSSSLCSNKLYSLSFANTVESFTRFLINSGFCNRLKRVMPAVSL